MPDKVALLLDGGFVKRKLYQTHRVPASAADVDTFCRALMTKPSLVGHSLFRAYYYDAPPFEGHATNPISRTPIDFSTTATARTNRQLLDTLELQPDFAVRKGKVAHHGWKLKSIVVDNLMRTPRTLTGNDFVPDIVQKGVDLRIGLDMAWIAMKRIVDILVLVTGDADFVPVMKFARREGLRVYLETMGHGVHRDLKAHADLVL